MLTFLVLATYTSKEVTDDELIAVLSEYPELYRYDNWQISERKERVLKEYTEITFAYKYRRTAKMHIAYLEGMTTGVDNAFFNACVDSNRRLEDRYECRFITEIGTVETVENDKAMVVVDHFGLLSRNNLQKRLLSEKVYFFLNNVLSQF